MHDIVLQIGLGLGAAALLGVGIWLIVKGFTRKAAVPLAFCVALAVILVGARFNHIKGFGLEAELWSDKQAEAVALVDRLKVLSVSTSEQAALLASRLGRWESGLSNKELVGLLQQTAQLLDTFQIDKARQEEILAPIRTRLEMNFAAAAYVAVDGALRDKANQLATSLANATSEQRPALAKEMQTVETDMRTFVAVDILHKFPTGKTLDPLVEFAKSAQSRAPAAAPEVNELAADLKQFQTTRTLRR
jgi:hypothetical protein